MLVPAAVIASGLGGLPLTGGALAKYAAKDLLGEGLWARWRVSSIGTTLLMLHFLVACARTPPSNRRRRARRIACRGSPWRWRRSPSRGRSILAPLDALPEPLAPKDLWAALWPVALGAVLAVDCALRSSPAAHAGRRHRSGDRRRGAHTAITGSRRFERVDTVLRQWPAAGLSLLALAIALGAALLR